MTWILVTLAGCAALIVYWWRRPNRASVDRGLDLQTWDAVADGRHNSNTDLIFWNGSFYLVHAASPYHMGSQQCRLIVRRSPDGRAWTHVAELGIPGEDIRDPKFAPIGGKLFLYALPNRGFKAIPYGTVYSHSTDGAQWSSFTTIAHPGWLFWRPKTRDGITWFVAAYWHAHGKSEV